MLFDNVTLKKGMDFAAQLYAAHRQLSPIDLRDILLGCFSGLPIAGKNQCDHIRKNIVSPSLDGASPVLMLIAALMSGLGRYDGLAQKCGAGMFIPICGFANSLVSSALEGKSEGLVYGIGSGMFRLAGTVLTYGVVSAVIFGAIRYLLFGGAL